ncbi:MAG TPA: ATP phosphoribosyltransferase [Lacipirellulaceae bacterium]|jgi:ATP phosphoribosyltransferase|nr:ATP phosphoribosyltransferase [Lacipirellulaceae bacterium]
MTENLRIGVPSKGRLAEMASQLLIEAGLKFRRQERSLFARVRDMPIEITFLRTDDIPVLCAEGAIDMGITGGDLIDETGVDLTTRLSLGMGNWRLSMCVPDDSKIQKPGDLANRRIATSFPHVTQKYLERHNVTAHIVQLTGSVEVMITLGVADAIVDLVETGSTLAANRLAVLDDLGRYEAVLVQNQTTQHGQLADRVVRRLEGIVIARSYSLLEYNVPESKLVEAEKVTPGFESPTISKLEESGWFAVRAMVKRSQVIEIMEQLDALGATAILETTITNCRL